MKDLLSSITILETFRLLEKYCRVLITSVTINTNFSYLNKCKLNLPLAEAKNERMQI